MSRFEVTSQYDTAAEALIGVTAATTCIRLINPDVPDGQADRMLTTPDLANMALEEEAQKTSPSLDKG